MSKLIDDLTSVLTSKLSRYNHLDNISARKHQWRLELQHAYDVEHNRHNADGSNVRFDNRLPEGRQETVQSAPIAKVEATGVLQDASEAVMPMSNKTGQHAQVGMHMSKSDFKIHQDSLFWNRALSAQSTVSRSSKPESVEMLAPPVPAQSTRNDAQSIPVRVIWSNGNAYVYVLAGVIDESQIDSTVKHLRQWFENSGLRISGIKIGGVEKWSAEAIDMNTNRKTLDHDNQALNRIY